MSTLNVANISDDQSTLSNGANSSDVLNNTTTVDTKFVTNGCAKCYSSFDQTAKPIRFYSTLNVSSIEDESTGYTIINFFSDFDGTNQSQGVAANAVSANLATINSSNMKTRTRNADGVPVDTGLVCTQVVGELA